MHPLPRPLQEERGAALKHKSEWAISRKRITALQKDMEVQRQEAQEMQESLEGAYHKVARGWPFTLHKAPARSSRRRRTLPGARFVQSLAPLHGG
jgi:hypothetical protein